MEEHSVALSADHANAIELLWGQRTAPKRGPKPALSVDAIATSGIQIADAQGLGAVTMQRIAARSASPKWRSTDTFRAKSSWLRS